MNHSVYAAVPAAVQAARPLVHHITNYVTVNDCANITLCAGGSPVMAHAAAEVAEMVRHAGALVLNIGTLDPGQAESMLIVGEEAAGRDIPIILDPVGAGATSLRTRTVRELISRLPIAVLKGNQGEIGTIAGVDATVRGVDSAGVAGDAVAIARTLAADSGMTVIMSGQTDIISDGDRTVLVENGHPLMGRISGTGCMAASVTGVYNAVSRDRVIASAAAFAAFGIAGERAAAVARGPGTFRPALFDALASVTPGDLTAYARIRDE